MATSTISHEHARRERLKESGMSEATATAIADALTSLRNEITADITARINWAVVLMMVGFATLGIIIAVTNGDSGPDIHNIYTTPVPIATAVAEILPAR